MLMTNKSQHYLLKTFQEILLRRQSLYAVNDFNTIQIEIECLSFSIKFSYLNVLQKKGINDMSCYYRNGKHENCPYQFDRQNSTKTLVKKYKIRQYSHQYEQKLKIVDLLVKQKLAESKTKDDCLTIGVDTQVFVKETLMREPSRDVTIYNCINREEN